MLPFEASHDDAAADDAARGLRPQRGVLARLRGQEQGVEVPWNLLAVSMNLGVFLWVSLPFGVRMRAPDFV